jgi:hypothetical protein
MAQVRRGERPLFRVFDYGGQSHEGFPDLEKTDFGSAK